MRKITLFILLASLFSFSCKKEEPAGQKEIPTNGDSPKRVIIGYMPTWKVPCAVQWDKLTHLCIAFATVKSDGSLNDAEAKKQTTLISDAHKNGVAILLSIGGAGNTEFSTAIKNENIREKLTESLVKITKDLNLDGIDVDYEEWDGSDTGASQQDLIKRTELEKFYKELRTALPKEKLITAAVSASWDKNAKWGYYNCFTNTMHEHLNYVNLMLYDETGPWPGSKVEQHSSWNFFEKSINHWLTVNKIPKEKLIAGVPFYGYEFKSTNSAENAASLSYKEILQKYPNENPESKDNIGLVYYNGLETIKKKAQYLKDQKLGGIMIWEISQDTNESNKSLLNEIYKTIK